MLHTNATEHTVRVHETNVCYASAGSGPPVVLMHGLGEASLVWYRNVDPLAKRFTVYAPDLWGHGRSADFGDYSVGTGVRFLVGFLDAVGAESAHVVGNSLGGLIAAATAVQAPERVLSLVLEGSAGLGRDLPLFLRAMTLPLLGELIAMPRRAGIKRLMHILLRHPEAVTEEFLDALMHERSRPGNWRVMLRILRHGTSVWGVKPAGLITDRLAELRTPTLLAWGRQDPIFPVAHAERAASLLPDAVLDVYEDCGHWPHFEYAERFNLAVGEFFEASERRRLR